MISIPVLQVTQRPGSSCFATSVNTLTTGSHATVAFRSPDLVNEGAEELLPVSMRLSLTTGRRTRIEVSERLSSRNEIVRVCAAGPATPVARSVLAARLIAAAGVSNSFCAPEMRSRPDANCAAPTVSETPIAAKIPVASFDMLFVPRPMAIKDITPGEPAGSGSRLSLNRVLKKLETAGTTPGACASFRQPVIPPAPLTGDVGRDRGDAGRALLFCGGFQGITRFRPTNRPTTVRPAKGVAVPCGKRIGG